MNGHQNKELSVSQSDSNVVTEQEIALKMSGRDTLTVDQANAAGDYLLKFMMVLEKRIIEVVNGLVL